MNKSTNKLYEYEALRGLSIVLLLILHSEIIGISVYGISLDPLAKFMAAFLLGSFFFLGGYFMDASLQRYQNNYWGFVKARFVRIYPPYWAALAFFTLLYTLKPFDTLIYILNLQIVFSPVYVKPLLTLWYISLLVVFLILFFILTAFSKQNTTKLVVFSTVVFFVVYFVHLKTGLFDPRFFRYYIIFFAGMCLYRFNDLWNRSLDTPVGYKLLAVFFSSLFYLWALVSKLSDIHGALILVVVIFALSWIWLTLSIFKNTSIGQWKIWIFLSTASYFAYLVHRPLWHYMDIALKVEEWGNVYMFNFLVGSITALILGYFLQLGYDKLLAAMHLK
ncbi:MAG: acyltransferase family protein [Anaerolineales bacterium]